MIIFYLVFLKLISVIYLSSASLKHLYNSQIRTKATLPQLAYEYKALEPAISRDIMEIHHQKHHNAYVTNYNAAVEKLQAAVAKGLVL